MKTDRMFMKNVKPNWKLPEGYLEMAKASELRIAKKYRKVAK